MIVVIASNSTDAKHLARLSNEGKGVKAWPSVEPCRLYAKACYPVPQWSKYRIYKVLFSQDGTMLEPTWEAIDVS